MSSNSRKHLRLRKVTAWVLGATISMAAVTAIAVEDQATRTPTQAECDAFKAATEAAMKNQLMIVNTFMGSATSTMQSAVSKGNSCIGNLAMLDFDLSRLIPDFGLLGSILSSAINKIVGGVINRACAALTDVMNKPSEIWNGIVGGINVTDQFQNWAGGISYSLPGGSGSSGGGRWSAASPGGAVDPWAEATKPGSTGNSTCTYGPNGISCSVAGVEQPPPTVSGADIGANFQYLLIACTGALQADSAAGNTSASPGSAAACKAAQDYLSQYAPYLDRNSVPRLPMFEFYVPGNTGSALGIPAQSPVVFSGGPTPAPAPSTGTGGAVFGGSKSESIFNLPVRK
jgi:hypothetical protein